MAQQPIFQPLKIWKNFHQSYSQVQHGTWDLHFPHSSPSRTTIDDLKETTRQFQALIARARREGRPVRAVGSRWSLSRAPATTGWTLNTNRLRGRRKVLPEEIDPAYKGSADLRNGLYLFQCGNTVADVNRVIESKSEGRALATSGAANGQTFVGAASTGTHGSALDFGALHDQIVAIHLVCTGSRHFWIERKSWPVMARTWVEDKLGATLKRDDDDLFNAAVMAFGSFGVIHAVVIETVPRYLLDCRPGTARLDADLWKAIGALDFSAHPFFGGQRPYFFQAVINPATDEVLLNANYKRPCPADRVPEYGLTQDPKAIGPGFDSLSTVGLILKAFKNAIPAFSRLAAKQLFDTKPRIGTPGEIYGYKAPLLHVASGSIAVALPDARRTIEALIKLYKQIGPVPLVLGCRYVRRSPALIAFNKFETGLMISMDGVDNADSRAYFAAAAERLEALGIDYSQHWGKVNAYTRARIDQAYGAANVRKWLAARKTVLPDPQDRALFDNAYMAERGLTG